MGIQPGLDLSPGKQCLGAKVTSILVVGDLMLPVTNLVELQETAINSVIKQEWHLKSEVLNLSFIKG